MKAYNQLAADVAECTAVNDHYEARALICDKCNFPDLKRAYDGIANITTVFGYLPEGVGDTCRELDNMLKVKLRVHLKDYFNTGDYSKLTLTAKIMFDNIWGSL